MSNKCKIAHRDTKNTKVEEDLNEEFFLSAAWSSRFRGEDEEKSTMSNLGTLYVIAAPSGAGKTSLVNALVKVNDNIKVSISHTTRPKRPGEQEGVDYYFVSKSEFEGMIAKHCFLEYAEVYGHYYGTSREWVEKQLQQDIDVILEIDWQGAQQVRKLYPASQSIFILPPSRQILKARLMDRNQDSEQVIEQRLAAADSDIAHYHEFDYLVVNNIFETALVDLQTILHANRLRQGRQAQKFKGLLSELLKK